MIRNYPIKSVISNSVIETSKLSFSYYMCNFEVAFM